MPAKVKASLPYWITLAASGWLYHVALGISAPGTGDQLGPDFWPKACLILMMITCAAGIAKALLLGGPAREDEHEPLMEGIPVEDQEEPARRSSWLLGGGIVLCIGYVLLFDVLGFFLDTFAFMLAFILLGRYRRVWIALAVSLAGSLVFMFVFMKIVYVALPIGRAPFSAVSLLLMQLMGIR